MTMKFKKLTLISMCLGALALFVASASAHRVNVFAWLNGDTIHVESKFSGGKKVKAGKVIVIDPQGVELLSGLTNDQGEYSFKIPKQTDLRIIIMAGQGHQGEWTIRKTELQGSAPYTMVNPGVSNKTAADQKHNINNTSAEDRAAASGTNIKPEELEAIIETVLDRKLQPVTRLLADMRQAERPGVRDIFAGIGYIFGLVGIAVYVQSRKKKA